MNGRTDTNTAGRRITILLLVSLFLGLVLVLGVGAAAGGRSRAAGPTCTVDPGGSGDYTTIGAAIADVDCTTVNVAVGVYFENGMIINRSLTLRGAGQDTTVIDAGGTDRVFYITAGSVTLSDLTIRNGNQMLGGAIRSEGTLRLARTTVTTNTSPSAGGAIWSRGGSLTLEDGCIILNNTATNEGGGIYSGNGPLSISDSTIISNSSSGRGGGILSFNGPATIVDTAVLSNTTDGSAFDRGGGIRNESGPLVVDRCTIAYNSAGTGPDDSGGGISHYGDVVSATVTISNSVISHNSSGDGGGIVNVDNTMTIVDTTVEGNLAIAASSALGGGIYNSGHAMLTGVTLSGNLSNDRGGAIRNQDAMTLTNVTISGNQAAEYGAGIYHSGSASTLTVRNGTIVSNTLTGATDAGGIHTYDGLVNVKNTILAYNDNGNCSVDGTGSITSQGYNLDSGTSCGFGGTGDQSNQDPKLGPLQDNGGPPTAAGEATYTHALLETSPAIDTGDCTGFTVDQRGMIRPADRSGYPNTSDGCDIGAYEWIHQIFLPLVLRNYP